MRRSDEEELSDARTHKKPVQEMSPSEWLAFLRQKYGYTGRFAAPKDSLEDFLQRIPSTSREKAREIWMSRYNMTVPVIHDELMQQYLQQIMPILRPKEKEIASTTYFGILPTREFNGYAGFTPRGDRIVILHEGLGYTLNFWSHWYLRTLEEDGRDYLSQNPARLCSTLRYVFQVWHGYEIDTKLPDIFPKTEDSWYLKECLTVSAIAFVIGHEMGHILKKHMAYNSNRERNHKMEYEADRIGLTISIRHSLLKATQYQNDNYYCKLMLFGPLFATAVMSLLGDTSSDTHPSLSSRSERLIQIYQDEMCLLLKNKFNLIVNGIDEKLFEILSKNSQGLLSVFTKYREIINTIDIGPHEIDNSWLRAELRTRTRN